MSEVKKVPEIRFAGFTEPWMKQKAYDIADYTKGNGYSKSDLSDAGTPIILYGRLYTKYQFAIRDVDTFAWPKDDSVFSQGNEVIVPASGETAEDIARAAAVERSGILLGGDLNILRPYNFINPLFLALAISNGNPQKELSKKAQGKSVVHIHNSDIQEVLIAYPSRTEQDQIAAFFLNIDNLLTIHQHKHEKLIVLKKAMLEKMFPQNDSNIPEVRFAGFTSPWERRKVSELADFSKGRGYSKGDLKEIGTPIILYGRLYTKYQFEIGEVDTFADIKPGSVFSKGDEVIVPASGETAEDIAIAAAVVKPGILLGGDLNILHPFGFMNPSFVALSISNGQPQKELARKAQGKSVVHVHNSDIQEVTICYPDREEQDKIVSTFSQLDNLITFHQRKHESLKRVKAALLQKMFV